MRSARFDSALRETRRRVTFSIGGFADNGGRDLHDPGTHVGIRIRDIIPARRDGSIVPRNG